MGALDRDYWKEPQKEIPNHKNPQASFPKKNNNKFNIIVSEYNKNVSIFNRYCKISDIILWNAIIIICLIFLMIFLTT